MRYDRLIRPGIGSVLVVASVAVALASGSLWAQSLLAPAQDPLAGSRVFGAKGCGGCHSVNGLGGKIGPDLGRIPRNRSFSDLAAAMWNHLPRMSEQMRKTGVTPPHLNAREIGNLIAFLFTLNYFEGSGSPDAGKTLFREKRCVICHQIRGVGGVVGPSLDSVGQSGSPIGFAAAIWSHGPAMAEAMRARGIKRPHLVGSELRDLLTYLKNVEPEQSTEPVSILPGRAQEGRRLFEEKRCIVCHRVQGRGGKVGPDLARRGLHRNLAEFTAGLWNKAPAMLNAMKEKDIPVPQLTAAEMADLVAYLRALQYFDEPGSAGRGRELLNEKRCFGCHSVDGRGGRAAVDFGRIDGLDSPAWVIAALWNHLSLMDPRSSRSKPSWPVLRAEDMTHLVAYFQELSRREP